MPAPSTASVSCPWRLSMYLAFLQFYHSGTVDQTLRAIEARSLTKSCFDFSAPCRGRSWRLMLLMAFAHRRRCRTAWPATEACGFEASSSARFAFSFSFFSSFAGAPAGPVSRRRRVSQVEAGPVRERWRRSALHLQGAPSGLVFPSRRSTDGATQPIRAAVTVPEAG